MPTRVSNAEEVLYARMENAERYHERLVRPALLLLTVKADLLVRQIRWARRFVLIPAAKVRPVMQVKDSSAEEVSSARMVDAERYFLALVVVAERAETANVVSPALADVEEVGASMFRV